MKALLIRDCQAAGCILVREAAVLHRVVQLDLETLAAAYVSPHRERAAEHRGPRREFSAGIGKALEQIARGEHPAHCALLVEPALSFARRVRAQHQPIPMPLDLGEGPKLPADRPRAHLLGYGDT